MGLPNIIIEFKSKASTAIKRGERGIVAILNVEEDADKVSVIKMEDIAQVPTELVAELKAYVERTFLGGIKPVKLVVLITADTIDNALKVLETTKFDYAVGPYNMTSEDATKMATFIKALRDNKNIKVKAVLPNTKADHEGIVNFTTTAIVVGEETYTTAEYCSRIAGLLAGTPLQISPTYHVLPEVEDVPKFTRSELDEKIDDGEFVIFHDGEKVKVGRAINSLTTVSGIKSEDYKYIKIVDTMDLIYTDVRRTIEDNYIGKYPNSYINKCLLIVSLQSYLEALRDDELLDQNIETGINVTKQRNYLKAKGDPVEDMTEQEIKEANTQTFVFLQSKYKILNAIEDIDVDFFI